MHAWGEGARAVVRVSWKGRNSGHVFIAEQTSAGTVYVDPQCGRRINVDFYMDQAIKGETKLMRVDNLKPSALIDKCVRRRKKEVLMMATKKTATKKTDEIKTATKSLKGRGKHINPPGKTELPWSYYHQPKKKDPNGTPDL